MRMKERVRSQCMSGRVEQTDTYSGKRLVCLLLLTVLTLYGRFIWHQLIHFCTWHRTENPGRLAVSQRLAVPPPAGEVGVGVPYCTSTSPDCLINRYLGMPTAGSCRHYSYSFTKLRPEMEEPNSNFSHGLPAISHLKSWIGSV